ncbi:MAG: PD-(D/E)XK nuclease family protein [Candidatus Rokubacteria bacterium]|nr:PD-(D/E)XK nuclease family protein [Candidatus Rokubacteria bacterium]
MDPFASRLAELCRTERTRAKWVVVPSHALGHTLGERLALAGTSWANLRFTTPVDLALPMAAPFLVERGIDPAPDEIGPALITRLLLELPGAVPVYFREMAEQPRMAEALWATIRELRLAGMRAADLRLEAFTSAAKHAELQALLTAYEEHLATRKLADTADVYREALQHLDICHVRPEDLWIELPGAIWAPLQQALLDKLPALRITPHTLRIPGLPEPARLRGAVESLEPSLRADSDLLAFLMRPGDAPAPKGDGSLAMFRAGGREAEVEEVFRRVLASGARLDDVEVACASADYVTLLWEKAQRHGWPVTVGPGLPVTLTRPARALLAFSEWVEGGYPAVGLRRLLQSGDVQLDLADGPSAGQAARLLAQSGATWGRESYAPAMTGLARSYRQRAADVENDDDEARTRYVERAAQAERLGAWIAGILELVPPAAADGRLPLSELIDGCITLVRGTASKQNEMDGAAAAVLADALVALRAVGSLARGAREAFALIRHQIEPLTVGADRARPGHLFVTMLRQAGHAGRSQTFVVGLEEGRVFPVLMEDAVLLDDERRALSPALPTSADRVGEALYAVVSRLAALGGSVCLSFSCRDLRRHRETFPSWLLLQALRVVKRHPDWTYQDLNRELGEPVSLVASGADRALSDAGWWLAKLNGLGPVVLPSVHAHFPWLAQGEAAELARESDVLTAYDGLVPAAGPRLDPRATGHAISATALEDLAKCPFRHFLKRGLKLDATEEAEPDRDRWLGPATRGSLLHGLYAAILRELRERKEQADPKRHGTWAREVADARLAELRALIPPPSTDVFDRERQELLRDLDLFLRLEAAAKERRPVGFEVSFGGGATEGEPLAQAEPVMIDLGTGLRFALRGRIDRIDRLADGSYEIIDYKTGRYWPDNYTGTFQGGRLLQHALYALAATHLLRRQDPKARVSASSYYLPTARGQAERATFPAKAAGLEDVLRDLFDIVGQGLFVHTADEDDCKFCEVGRACGRDPYARAERKLENDANDSLRPYWRLGEHE